MAEAVVTTTTILQPCPPGMEFLIPTSGLFIRQQIELLEVLIGYDTNNKYEIIDANGVRLYLAAEQTDCMLRICLGTQRPFTILIINPMGAVCLRIHRPCGLWFFCGCFGHEVEVFTGMDVLVGKVVQKTCNCCCGEFLLFDAVGNKCLMIKGPCHMCMCCEAFFPIIDVNGAEIGMLHKQWGGCLQEMCTRATNFDLVYPVNLDATMKCLLIAATFLIDFMYFEKKSDNNHHN